MQHETTKEEQMTEMLNHVQFDSFVLRDWMACISIALQIEPLQKWIYQPGDNYYGSLDSFILVKPLNKNEEVEISICAANTSVSVGTRSLSRHWKVHTVRQWQTTADFIYRDFCEVIKELQRFI